MRLTIRAVLCICLLGLSLFCCKGTSIAATEDLTGNLYASYSSSSGRLSVAYSGNATLSSSATYTWYRDGSVVSNSSDLYVPSTAATYYCTVTDTNNYNGTLRSNSITLYRVTAKNATLDNSYGLYEAGDNVTATADVSKGKKVTNWSVNIAGIALPKTGSTITFRMPAQNITLNAEIEEEYSIKINGGTADKYVASPGDTVTIRASSITGKTFEKWEVSGGSVANVNSEVTTVRMPSSELVITAIFNDGNTEKDGYGPGSYKYTDPTHVQYKVLRSNNYIVKMYNANQGPQCVACFQYAQAYDWLVTNFFNVTINNSLQVYETPTPITIQLTIPADLQKAGRNWRMICVTRNGAIYSFQDEDEEDETLTFSPDRFYAFAMCYNDFPKPDPEGVDEPGNNGSDDASSDNENVRDRDYLYEEPSAPSTAPSSSSVKRESSTLHSASESRTTDASSSHSADESRTEGEVPSPPLSVPSAGSRISSDMSSAIRSSAGEHVPVIDM